MVYHVYSVVAHEGGWAVEHMGKVLDVHATRRAAGEHVDRLARLTQVSGHDAEVIVEGPDGQVESDDIYRRIERRP